MTSMVAFRRVEGLRPVEEVRIAQTGSSTLLAMIRKFCHGDEVVGY